MREPFGHDANHFVRFALEEQPRAHDGAIAVELTPPEVVRQHGHQWSAELILLLGIPSAQRGSDAKDVHERRGRRESRHAHRIA
jgi:hypothetical protein